MLGSVGGRPRRDRGDRGDQGDFARFGGAVESRILHEVADHVEGIVELVASGEIIDQLQVLLAAALQEAQRLDLVTDRHLESLRLESCGGEKRFLTTRDSG